MLRQRYLPLAALCALPIALVACGKTPAPDPRNETPLVRTVAVTPGNESTRAFTGTVAARVQSDLGFRVPGKVLERLVDAGQTVKRGQLMLRIDPVDLRLAANAQQEAVAAAQARARQASDEEARYLDLRGTGAISASAYDQIKAAADSARAQLKAALAQAEIAGNTTRYAELVADADGVVMETLAEPGQVVGAGQVVVRIARTGKREAVIQVPETLRPTVGSTAQATLFGSEGAPVDARLRQLSDTADRVTRTFEARYVLEGNLAHAPLGSTVTVRLPGGSRPAISTLQIPLSAVFDEGKGPAVWRVKGTQVVRVPVTISSIEDERAQVTGSLQAGDKIVALGAHLLRDGAAVRLADQGAMKAPAPVGAVRE
ncbi:efflux RND transporter periplasmic adaptor subunit [Acidovorax sp. NCPPB 3576]|uniref:efflux RND transporter periplasmic adaptor subunit n=1 Tax=Acidovorax sp. NCPPB 3576 TaxID=2940488 RepID=UPI002349F263|nr:efflux RND transporter periplasmic adaptor subunit [Acidovorax sp. NCPPB 3576]WCM89468.1 efflux RND transporter periplasmic adaptor subunit [Acidovorax sp. NCPPB 3576]